MLGSGQSVPVPLGEGTLALQEPHLSLTTWVQLPLRNIDLAPTNWAVGEGSVPLILTVELIVVHNPPFWEVRRCHLKQAPLLQGRETEEEDWPVQVGRWQFQ